MQKIMFTAVLLCAAAYLPAQEVVPPKGVSTIIVRFDGDAQAAYRKLAVVLQGEGFSFENSNTDLMTISTGWVPYRNVSIKINAIVLASEGTADIKMNATFFVEGVPELGISRTENRGMKNSPFARSWDAFVGVAKKMEGTLSFQ